MGGDPLQLGPVLNGMALLGPPVYLSRMFRDSFQSRHGSLVFLLGSHRQSPSSWFVGCLDRIRTGKVTDTDLLLLNATSDGINDELWNSHTQLRATNREVCAINKARLERLPGPAVEYTSRDEINPSITHPNRLSYIRKQLEEAAPASIFLKPGAVVLTTRELDKVPTGTQGVVLECVKDGAVCELFGRRVHVSLVWFECVDNCNVRLGSRLAMPVLLSWAMTIHRAQGTNLSTLAIDFSALQWCKEGLVYAGLSRCRLLEGLFIRAICRKHIVVCSDALKFYSL